MLIRLGNSEIVEYPDELGALVLAEPRYGEVPDFSLEEVNCVINGALALLFDEAQTLEQNIEETRVHYTRWGSPSAENMEKALAQIQNYKEKMAISDIGYSDRALVMEMYGIQSSSRKTSADNIIDQDMRPVADSALLEGTPSAASFSTADHDESE